MSTAPPRRRGRPPREQSGDTARRILDVARRLFAEYGYAATTTRMVADEAGLTSNALYHYHPSKLELYAAVHVDSRRRIAEQLAGTLDQRGPYTEQLCEFLDATVALIDADPTLASFLGSARVDLRRRAELEHVLKDVDEWWVSLLRDIVDAGVESGELAAARRDAMVAFAVSLAIGLNDLAIVDAEAHRAAVAVAQATLRGQSLRRRDGIPA